MFSFIKPSHQKGENGTSVELGIGKGGDVILNSHSTKELIVWYANIDDVDSVTDEDPLIMSLLLDEKIKVKRFLFPDDQKRALLSILLQRALIRSYTGASDEDYELLRSREGKPYVISRREDFTFKTWNFNVSHHGKYVSIVAHPHILVGMDIVDLSTRSNMSRSGTAMQFVMIFEPQLTKAEIAVIASQPMEEDRYSYFYILWSLKEAYIKAIGQGLGYDLQQVEFAVYFEPGYGLSNNGNVDGILRGGATVRVAGQLRQDWRMDFVSLDATHVMTISRGPLNEALPSYQALAGWDKLLTPAALVTEGSGSNSVVATKKNDSNGKGLEESAHVWEPLPPAERKLISALYPPQV